MKIKRYIKKECAGFKEHKYSVLTAAVFSVSAAALFWLLLGKFLQDCPSDSFKELMLYQAPRLLLQTTVLLFGFAGFMLAETVQDMMKKRGGNSTTDGE